MYLLFCHYILFLNKKLLIIFLLAILSKHVLPKLCDLLCFLGILRYLCVLFLCKDLFFLKKKKKNCLYNLNYYTTEIMVPLKYLSNFWRTLEMPRIKCELELILDWSTSCVIIYTNVSNQIPTFTISETNVYVPVVLYQLMIIQNYCHN